jgi:hypothetical protein
MYGFVTGSHRAAKNVKLKMGKEERSLSYKSEIITSEIERSLHF